MRRIILLIALVVPVMVLAGTSASAVSDTSHSSNDSNIPDNETATRRKRRDMNRIKRLVITVTVVISFFLIFSQTAYASIDVAAFDQITGAYYIDPGTGSMIIQVLIGAVVGGLAIIGIYRVRVKNFLQNLFKKRKSDAESE